MKKNTVICILTGLAMILSCSGTKSGDVTDPVFKGAVSAGAATTTSITVSWEAATDDNTDASNIRYLIFLSKTSGGQNFTSQDEIATGTTQIEITGLDPSTVYYFVVRAQDEAGNKDANTVEVSASGITPHLNEPAGITTTSMDLSWDAYELEDFLEYRLHRGETAGFTPGSGNLIGTFTDSSSITHPDSGLTEGTTYYYVVILVNSDSDRISSNEVRATAMDPAGTGGTISTNVVWGRGNSPVTLSSDVKIDSAGKLTVDPGVTVNVNTSDLANLGSDASKIEIYVDGTVDFTGTSDEIITFKSSAGSPGYNNWWGIYLSPVSSHSSILSYNEIKHSGNGIQVHTVSPVISNITLDGNGSGSTNGTLSAYSGSDATIANVISKNSNQTGFYFEYFGGSASDLISENNNRCFHINDSNGMGLDNAYGDNCSEGLRISSAADNSAMVVTVGNSTFQNSTGTGVYVQDGIAVLSNVSIMDSGGRGIYIEQNWNNEEGGSLDLKNSVVSGSGAEGIYCDDNPSVNRNIFIRDTNLIDNTGLAVDSNSGSYNIALTRVHISGNNGAASGTIDLSQTIPTSSAVPPQYDQVDSILIPMATPVEDAGDTD